MKHFILLLVSLRVFYYPINAQVITSKIGADIGMLAGVSSVPHSPWSIVNNPSLMVIKPQIGGVFNYQRRYNLQELTLQSFGFQLPLKRTMMGIAYLQYGFSSFMQSRVVLSLAHQIGKQFSLGIQGNYYLTSIPEYGSKSSLGLAIGLSGNLTKQLSFGLYINQPEKAYITNTPNFVTPTFIRAGLGYKLHTTVQLFTEVDQTITGNAFAAGLSYQFSNNVTMRMGIHSFPFYYSFGTLLSFRYYQIAVSSNVFETLGFTPQVGLIFNKEAIK